VSVFNSHSSYGTVAEYRRYSRPYDKRVFDALADTKLTVMHLHNLDRSYLGEFKDFRAPVLQYSVKGSGIPVSEVRGLYSQTIAGGVDEFDFKTLTVEQMREQWAFSDLLTINLHLTEKRFRQGTIVPGGN
jgi:uroporphyrinogen-III decarboxylase